MLRQLSLRAIAACRHSRPLWMISVLLLSPCPLMAYQDDPFLTDRVEFVKARDALRVGDREGFYRQKALVSSDYPLADYLEFEALSDQFRLSESPGKKEIQALNDFEKHHKDKVLLRRLTRLLQERLAETEKWSLFLGVAKSTVASPMPCSTLRARFETGQVTSLSDAAALDLWLQPVDHHERCVGVLKALEARQAPSIKSIWERIFTAMEKDRPEYAESMLGYLGTRDRKRVQQWITGLESPEAVLTGNDIKKDNLLNRRMVVDLVLAWSKDDPVAATEHWLGVRDNYRFFSDRLYDTNRALAMRGAYRRLPESYAWLNSFEARPDDLELKEWRVRTALFAQDWPQVLRSIRQLPKEEQAEDHWAYWEARAFEQAGHSERATQIYQELAELQSYHGFLSADKLASPYAIKNVPIVPDTQILQALQQNNRLIRAREFFRADIAWEGRREWTQVLADASLAEYAASAVLARDWELHDRAIFSAAKAEQKQALELRFPMLYTEYVAKAAKTHRVEPAWVFGVMRRESGYMSDVRSSAGAMGLMQLMPRTAKYVAELQGKPDWEGDLTDVSTNIDFGTFYLRHVRDKFDDRLVLATASYNAGPHRVQKWLPDKPMDADVWIDSIPFTETRRYVRAVLAYMAIYEWHLHGEPTPLRNRLDKIQPEVERTGSDV